jgi:hypothetical protein
VSWAAGAAWILFGSLVVAPVAAAQSSRATRATDRVSFDLVLANGRVIDPETGLAPSRRGADVFQKIVWGNARKRQRIPA